MNIPNEMIEPESSKENGTIVSIRNLQILMGLSGDELKESDRMTAARKEILEKEPWRNKTKFVPIKEGSRFGFIEGRIYWSGTEFEKE